MKILLVSSAAIQTPPEAYGGMEREANWLAEALVGFGHETHVLAKTGSTVTNVIEGESEADFVENIRGNITGFDIVIDFSHDKLVTRTFPNVPQINTYQVMTVSHPHNPVFISKAQREHCKHLNAPVIYYGLNHNEYPLYEGPRQDYLLYVGSLIEEKRVHWVAELARITNHRAIICGPNWQPSYWPTLEDIATWDNVEVRDEVGGEEKIQLIQQAKCLVHPVGDKNWVEAGAIIVLESLLLGTPVITSTNGCLPEYVMRGMNGYACPTLEEMVVAVGRVDLLSSLRCRLSVRHYNHLRMAQEYIELAEEVIDGKQW